MMWVCHNLWLQYRYSMDEQYLRELFFPLLKMAVNFYIHLADFNVYCPLPSFALSFVSCFIFIFGLYYYVCVDLCSFFVFVFISLMR